MQKLYSRTKAVFEGKTINRYQIFFKVDRGGVYIRIRCYFDTNVTEFINKHISDIRSQSKEYKLVYISFFLNSSYISRKSDDLKIKLTDWMLSRLGISQTVQDLKMAQHAVSSWYFES